MKLENIYMKKWNFIQEVLARFFHDHTLCLYSSGRHRAPDWLRADIGPRLHLNAEHSAVVPADRSRAIIQSGGLRFSPRRFPVVRHKDDF